LGLEPSERPDVDELIDVVEHVLRDLPEDGSDD
jgi:serine/threonine kinase 16